MNRGEKRAAFESAINADGEKVTVLFDPSHEDATVPAHLRDKPDVAFVYGYDLIITIPDLLVTEHGISATLSFGRRPQYTFVPWDAVFGMVRQNALGQQQRIAMWPEDAPAAIVNEAKAALKHPAHGFLHLVKGGKA